MRFIHLATLLLPALLHCLSIDGSEDAAGVIAEGWSSSVTDSGNALGLAGNSRGYLTSSADGGLLKFNLLSKILRFTADVSRVPCSVNAALYFVDMAGAYCDIQTDN